MSSSRLTDSARAFREAFASKGLRRLQLALAGSVIGDWAFSIALAVYAYNIGGAETVGLLALARWTVAALAAPFLSLLADRYRRRSVMLASDSIRLLATAGAAVAVGTSAPSGFVYAAALIVTAVSTAFQPAQTALLPSLTSSPEQLTAANVVTSTIESVGTFLGPALGGLMLVWAGTGWVMAIDSLTFAWSLAMLSGIPRGERPIKQEQSAGFLAEVAEGFAAVGSNARMRLIMGLFGAQTFVCGTINVLIVVMALQLLGMGESGVGLLNAAIGVGGLAGAVVAAALVGRGRQSLNFAGGLVAWGVPIALIAVFTNSGFALAMLVVVGVGNVLVDVAGMTLLQRVAPDDVLGRVFGVLETVFALTIGLGGAAAPLMIHLLGIRGALVLTGALLPVLVGITWPMLIRLDVGVLLPERLALMRGVPFLEPLAEATLERISGLLEPVTVAAGEAIFSQGEAGDRFYLIESGQASVVQDGTEVARLAEGGYFGEIALVQDIPRTATVRATSDLALLALDRDEFIAAVTGHAPSREAADAVISSRLSGLRAGVATL
ncbi:MAG TPA: MFS transporter [Gaiellales bacterium]|jgi:MFS family permease|nr:MFS transporter [Gaiellales bacterium]